MLRDNHHKLHILAEGYGTFCHTAGANESYVTVELYLNNPDPTTYICGKEYPTEDIKQFDRWCQECLDSEELGLLVLAAS